MVGTDALPSAKSSEIKKIVIVRTTPSRQRKKLKLYPSWLQLRPPSQTWFFFKEIILLRLNFFPVRDFRKHQIYLLNALPAPWGSRQALGFPRSAVVRQAGKIGLEPDQKQTPKGLKPSVSPWYRLHASQCYEQEARKRRNLPTAAGNPPPSSILTLPRPGLMVRCTCCAPQHVQPLYE